MAFKEFAKILMALKELAVKPSTCAARMFNKKIRNRQLCPAGKKFFFRKRIPNPASMTRGIHSHAGKKLADFI